jgi:plastocyanin
MTTRHTLLALSFGLAAACGGSLPPVQSGASPQQGAAADAMPAATAPTAHAAEPAVAGSAASSTNATAPGDVGAAVAPADAAQAATPPAAAVPTPATGVIHGTITSVPAHAAKSAVAYLEDGPAGQAVTATITNRQMAFSPNIAIATVGAKVTLKNEDPFPHNVFSPDGGRWDIGQIQQHGVKVKVFSRPGAYTLLCNLHPNMKAYLVIVPTGFFAKADKQGNFTIKDVPSGGYKLTVWSPGMQVVTQAITVAGDASAHFELHR